MPNRYLVVDSLTYPLFYKSAAVFLGSSIVPLQASLTHHLVVLDSFDQKVALAIALSCFHSGNRLFGRFTLPSISFVCFLFEPLKGGFKHSLVFHVFLINAPQRVLHMCFVILETQ